MWSKTLPAPNRCFFTGPGREAFRVSDWLDCNSEQGVMQVFSAEEAAQSLRGNRQRKRVLSKRLEMIPGLAQALFAILDGFRRAAADAGHAVGAVAAPDGLAVLNRDVVRWAEPGALTAAGAGIAGRKGICFDEE